MPAHARRGYLSFLNIFDLLIQPLFFFFGCLFSTTTTEFFFWCCTFCLLDVQIYGPLLFIIPLRSEREERGGRSRSGMMEKEAGSFFFFLPWKDNVCLAEERNRSSLFPPPYPPTTSASLLA